MHRYHTSPCLSASTSASTTTTTPPSEPPQITIDASNWEYEIISELTYLREQLLIREAKLQSAEENHRQAVEACTKAERNPVQRRGSVSGGIFDLWMEVNKTTLALEDAKRMKIGMAMRVVLCAQRYKRAFGKERFEEYLCKAKNNYRD